jgi:hypothetical protein
MEPEGSLPHSQQPDTYPCAEPDQSSPCSPSYFSNIYFNIILSSTPGSERTDKNYFIIFYVWGPHPPTGPRALRVLRGTLSELRSKTIVSNKSGDIRWLGYVPIRGLMGNCNKNVAGRVVKRRGNDNIETYFKKWKRRGSCGWLTSESGHRSC